MSAELRVAEPLKSRILLEMAADLEAMADHYRRQGHSSESAMVRAEERLLASDVTIQELVRVHTTAFERGASRLAWALRSGFDHGMIALGVCPLLLIAALVVGRAPAGSPWPSGLWLLVGLGIALTAEVARQTLRVRAGTGEWRRARLADLEHVLFIGAMGGLFGVTGCLIAVHRMAAELAGGGPMPGAAWAEGVTAAASLLAAGLVVAIAAALAWGGLANRIAMRDQAECAVLLG